MVGSLALKPLEHTQYAESSEPIDMFKTEAFKRKNPARKRKLRRGVELGYIDKFAFVTDESVNQLDDDSAASQHENFHYAALAGLEAKGGVTRTGMSILPGEGYRAVTWFAINPNLSIEDRAWIILVSAMGSGAEDHLNYGYTHVGRGSDKAQEDNAANIISIVKYHGRVKPNEVKSEAKSIADGYVKQYADEHKIWSLTKNKVAA